MSRSSAPDPARAQVDPTAALVSAVAVALGVSLYAVAAGGAVAGVERSLAEPTLDRVETGMSEGGVVSPARRSAAPAVGPEGYETNASLTVGGRRFAAGPPPPRDGDAASRRVGVRLAPGRVRAGRLRVVVWT